MKPLIRSTGNRTFAGKAESIKLLEFEDLTALTTAQIEKLYCGQIIIKNENGNKHAYIVSYKQHHVGICITYTDCENVETISYDYTEGQWVFNSKDVTHIAG